MSNQNRTYEAIYQHLLEKYGTSPSNAVNLELVALAAEVNGRGMSFSRWESAFGVIFQTLCENLEANDQRISNKDKFTFLLVAARCADGFPDHWKEQIEELYALMLASFGSRPSNAEKITLLMAAAESVANSRSS
jgi:hypothetical protein